MLLRPLSLAPATSARPALPATPREPEFPASPAGWATSPSLIPLLIPLTVWSSSPMTPGCPFCRRSRSSFLPVSATSTQLESGGRNPAKHPGRMHLCRDHHPHQLHRRPDHPLLRHSPPDAVPCRPARLPAPAGGGEKIESAKKIVEVLIKSIEIEFDGIIKLYCK